MGFIIIRSHCILQFVSCRCLLFYKKLFDRSAALKTNYKIRDITLRRSLRRAEEEEEKDDNHYGVAERFELNRGGIVGNGDRGHEFFVDSRERQQFSGRLSAPFIFNALIWPGVGRSKHAINLIAEDALKSGNKTSSPSGSVKWPRGEPRARFRARLLTSRLNALLTRESRHPLLNDINDFPKLSSRVKTPPLSIRT